MRPLIIDEEFKSRIKDLVQYAEKNPFSMDDLLDIYNKQKDPAGSMEMHTIITEFGYKIVYSIEHQNAGPLRHLSMSVDDTGKLPHEIVVREIMSLIGFESEMEDCIVVLEDIGPNNQAINVLELIK